MGFNSGFKGLISKVVSVHAMNVYGGRRGMAPLTLKLGTSWRWVVSSIPSHVTPKKPPLPTEQEAEWVPDPSWMYCRQEMSFAHTQNWTPDCLAHSPVSLLTILAQLLKYNQIYYNFATYNTLQCPDLKNAFEYFIKQDLVCGAIK